MTKTALLSQLDAARQAIGEKEKVIGEKEKVIGEQGKVIEELQRQLADLRRQIFGGKSERFKDGKFDPNQGVLPGFGELVSDQPGQPEEKALVDEPADKPSKKPHRKPTKADEISFPADMEVKERLIKPDPAELVDAEGRPLKHIRDEEVIKLAYHARKAYLIKFIYPVYASHEASAEFVQAPAVKSLVPSAACDSSFVAHLLTAKCAYGLTFYRIEEMLAAEGVKVSQSLMSGLFLRAGRELEIIGDTLRAEVFRRAAMHVDETTFPFLAKGQGKGKASTGYLWAYVAAAGPPLVWYQFTEDRSHSHPRSLLENWAGHLVADAYGAYKSLHDDPQVKIRWQACWAHGRRKFEKHKDSPFAQEMLALIRDLFLAEREVWRLPEAERLAFRKEHCHPLVDSCFARMKDRLAVFSDPKNGVNAACQYFLNYEDSFKLFLEQPFLRIDNNPAERSLRRVTINRKNSLFMGSKDGGKSYAAILSLVQSCRNLGLSPESYLVWLLDTLGGKQLTRDALRDYLPDAYATKTGKTLKSLF
jgi:hypothetical protein